MFDSSSFFLDPTSQFGASTSFLSFSSFADLDSSAPSWNLFASDLSKPGSSSSNTSTPSPSNPFEIIRSAFETPSPPGEIGIFHTPAKAGPSKLSGSESSTQTVSQRSSSSSASEEWRTPVTPSLTTKSSCDSFQSFATGSDLYLSPPRTAPFSWDDASSTLASSSYEAATPAPHRTTSNPTLGSTRTRPSIKPIASMPALKEEDSIPSTPSQWFDGTEFLGSSFPQTMDVPQDVTDDALADDFEWVFGDYGLGQTVSAESTIFTAFPGDHPTPADEGAVPTGSYEYQPIVDASWFPGPSTHDVRETGDFGFAVPSFDNDYTIDPMAVMATNDFEEESRPSSAPRLNANEGSGQLLSVPRAEMMSRSVSSDANPYSRHAPARDLFSYAPQHIPSTLPTPQPLYTSEPSPSYSRMGSAHHLRAPTPSRLNRRASAQLSIQINPPNFSYFPPSAFPPTPQSATFQDLSHPMPMMSRKLSGGLEACLTPTTSSMPAHLLRAQAIVQMQEAKEEAERQELRRQASARRVRMAEASVMQPQVQNLPRQVIMGWEGPSARNSSLPVLTTAPLVNVHPPPAQYYLGTPLPSPHRVHPPPYMGNGRPVARLPSPNKRRTSKLTPTKVRSPSTKRKAAPAGGAFSWGATTFINFTPDDADKLLTGVAPSGSQGKRRREEDSLFSPTGEIDIVGEDRERSKRSRSDE
ncbi:MAG: hypothetical protein TREMPRED_004536 [Tremellales sp. Tagirdzhanova-0007]|nr:MAG: hypothetical protein TREMPRED_004536 [Tremellales sp. Tagirdzhanova-0007]